MFRIKKNIDNSVTLSVYNFDIISNISDVVVEYGKRNTDSVSSIDCVVSDTNCYSNTITFSINLADAGGEFAVTIYEKISMKPIYSGIMSCESVALTDGLNGIKIM